MNLNQAVIEKNIPNIDSNLKFFDINSLFEGFTPLWCAITGCNAKIKTKNNRADFDITKKLLDLGADPNKKCLLVPPLNVATFQNKLDIMTLLILYGANPNNHGLEKCTKNGDTMIANYVLPIQLAIDNCDLFGVKLLVNSGALFNKNTLLYIDNLKKEKKKVYKQKIDETLLNELENLSKIKKFIKINYSQTDENNSREFLRMNAFTGKTINIFPVLEKDYI